MLSRFDMEEASLSGKFDDIKSESINISRFSWKIPECTKINVIILTGVDASGAVRSTGNFIFE